MPRELLKEWHNNICKAQYLGHSNYLTNDTFPPSSCPKNRKVWFENKDTTKRKPREAKYSPCISNFKWTSVSRPVTFIQTLSELPQVPNITSEPEVLHKENGSPTFLKQGRHVRKTQRPKNVVSLIKAWNREEGAIKYVCSHKKNVQINLVWSSSRRRYNAF